MRLGRQSLKGPIVDVLAEEQGTVGEVKELLRLSFGAVPVFDSMLPVVLEELVKDGALKCREGKKEKQYTATKREWTHWEGLKPPEPKKPLRTVTDRFSTTEGPRMQNVPIKPSRTPPPRLRHLAKSVNMGAPMFARADHLHHVGVRLEQAVTVPLRDRSMTMGFQSIYGTHGSSTTKAPEKPKKPELVVRGKTCQDCKIFVYSRCTRDMRYCRCRRLYAARGQPRSWNESHRWHNHYVYFGGWTSHDTKVEERTIRATHEDLYSDWQLRINKYGWILPHGDQVE